MAGRKEIDFFKNILTYLNVIEKVTVPVQCSVCWKLMFLNDFKQILFFLLLLLSRLEKVQRTKYGQRYEVSSRKHVQFC